MEISTARGFYIQQVIFPSKNPTNEDSTLDSPHIGAYTSLAPMADVRSLLRSERESRKITHPFAAYSTTGLLVCTVCHIQLKSESLWDSHLRSAEHASQRQRTRMQPVRRASPPTRASTGGRKRKADGEEVEGRKKAKAIVDGVPANFFDTGKDPVKGSGVDPKMVEEGTAEEQPPEPVKPQPQSADLQTPDLPPGFFDSSAKDAPSGTPTVDEEEWAAFTREVATPPPEASVTSALKAAPTISAAPLTAAELAARTTAEESTQKKELKEAELEGEKEDAARQLEEEFDQMEELEVRVRRLREKREELRQKREGVATGQMDTNGVLILDGRGDDSNDTDDTDDDDDDDDDGDGWGRWGLQA